MDWDKASAELTRKLDPKNVKDRTQGGGKVQFIEGWHAVSEMNRIFGFGAWDRETMALRMLGEPRTVDGKQRVEYMARVRVTVRLSDGVVVRDGSGFGQGIDRDVGQAHESALKEAETDAMKRAMMTFGNPFGLALYDKSRENVGPAEKPAPAAPTAERVADDMIVSIRQYGVEPVTTDQKFIRDFAALRARAPEQAARVEVEINTQKEAKAA